jgi:HD-GYP domain-containing protein (c-di-GMP phosphodiesterase class II)
MSLEDALAELRRCAGSQFDPQLVETFCRLVRDRTTPERLRSAAG